MARAFVVVRLKSAQWFFNFRATLPKALLCGAGLSRGRNTRSKLILTMLRSQAIPEVLDRICDEWVDAAIVLNSDGELLGSSSHYDEPEELCTLLADVALDYQHVGEEYSGVAGEEESNQLKYLLIEIEVGLVGIAPCPGIECFVIAISKSSETKSASSTPRGLVTARLAELATYFQEALVPLIER